MPAATRSAILFPVVAGVRLRWSAAQHCGILSAPSGSQGAGRRGHASRRAAAEEAHRQAQELAADADQQAKDADKQVAAAERVGKVTAATAEDTAQRLDSRQINGDLESHTKAELLDLAAAIDIERRTTLTKAELISAIERASRTTR